jgi:hypothetical protein
MVSLLVGKLPGCEAILHSTMSNRTSKDKTISSPHWCRTEDLQRRWIRNKIKEKGKEGRDSLCLKPWMLYCSTQ